MPIILQEDEPTIVTDLNFQNQASLLHCLHAKLCLSLSIKMGGMLAQLQKPEWIILSETSDRMVDARFPIVSLWPKDACKYVLLIGRAIPALLLNIPDPCGSRTPNCKASTPLESWSRRSAARLLLCECRTSQEQPAEHQPNTADMIRERDRSDTSSAQHASADSARHVHTNS